MCVKSRNFIAIALLISVQVIAQNNIAIGQWRDHLAYNKGTDVVVAKNRIFCIADGNLFYYDTDTKELVRQSKTAGYSDVSAVAIDYDNASSTLVIGYKNANVDIVQNEKIINIPVILKKQTTGNKTINNVTFNNGICYLSTGLGIIVFDVVKKEIKDTYTIDSLIQNVNEIAFDNEFIYAATDIGIYKANKNNNFLASYDAWSKIAGNYVGKNVTSLVVFSDSLVANYNASGVNHFGIYDKNNDVWLSYKPDYPFPLYTLNATANELVACFEGGIVTYNSNRNIVKVINQYGNAQPQYCVKDNQNNYWIADKGNSLIKVTANSDIAEGFRPRGPFNNNSAQLKFSGNNLWVSPGGAPAGNNTYTFCNLSIFKNNEWGFIPATKFSNAAGPDNYWDAMFVAPNKTNNTKGFVGSFGRGVAQVENDSVTKVYSKNNSTLKEELNSGGFVRVGGMDYDSFGNLWVANSHVSDYLDVFIAADSTWQSFQTRATAGPQIQNLIVSKTNKVWILSERNGLLVYDANNTFDDVNDDKEAIVGFEAGKGAIPGSEIRAVVEDLNGEIWIGSDKGISVLYAPDEIFGENRADAQQIKIDLDGYIGYLLESDKVKAIVVDDANRKWIGTENSGLFFISADGTKQLQHFTVDNSPLLSNSILSLALNHVTGELFIATDNGVMSYKSTATQGYSDKCNDVLVYPNPVKPNYTGTIAIKGLLQTSNVKVTDAIGNLVFSTKTLGGQAIWDGKNMNGDKAEAGVYFVLTSNDDGTAGCSTKVVIVR